ncbi:MAG: EFR1 family ferrodoxin [Spirochaetales bacterium]|nr:EFR1 family ferrodoxin [Spirochaetales bacterium]
MLILYFSGTGNTKFIAEYFAGVIDKKYNCANTQLLSIEAKLDFDKIINSHEIITFCYPVYGSCVPEIMREFVEEHKFFLDGKKIIIFATQLLFSGDGARVFTPLLKGIQTQIIYAKHFNMPNNICNFSILKEPKLEKVNIHLEKIKKSIESACKEIDEGKIYLQGFNPASQALGYLTQRCYFKKIEQKAKRDVRISLDCISCGKCIEICPRENLELSENKIIQKGRCTLCYRCVNTCPAKAITVLVHGKPKWQYKGIKL